MTVQRSHPRHAARVKLKISFPDLNEFQHSYTKNISKGGMFLATPRPLGKGTRVVVQLLPPGAPKPFSIEGEIAHSVDTPTAIKKKCTPGMGIKFINMNAPLRAALVQYIKDLLAGKVPADPPPVRPAAAAAPAPGGATMPLNQPPARSTRPAAAAPNQPTARPGQQAAPAAQSGATMPLHRPAAQGAPRPASAAPSRPAAKPAIEDLRAYIKRLDEASRALRTRNHYEFLGVDPGIPREEIRRAYNRLAMQFHPDRAPQALSAADRSRADKLFADIGEIFEGLTAPRSRVIYDLSIGVTREPEDEEEALALKEERQRFREAYALQFPDRVQQAERFAQMAETAAQGGNRKAAANNYKLALSLDPLNDEYKSRMETLKQ